MARCPRQLVRTGKPRVPSRGLLSSAAFLVAVLGAVSSAAAAPQTLQTSALILTVDPEAGELVSLKDVNAGPEYLASQAKPLFRMNLPNQSSTVWDASKFDLELAETSKLDGETVLVANYVAKSDEPIAGIEIQVAITAKSNEAELRFEILSLTNAGHIIDWIEFPTLFLADKLGDTYPDDRVFFPGGDGSVTKGEGLRDVYDPNQGNWISRVWAKRQYPGGISMQFMAYYDGTSGICAGAWDSQGRVKDFGFDHKTWAPSPYVDFFIRRVHPHEPTFDMDEISYPVVIAPCSQSWQAAAQWYRAWALKQSWATESLALGANPPWILSRPTVIEANLRPLGVWQGSDTPPPGTPVSTTGTDPNAIMTPMGQWAPLSSSWAQQLGTPTMPLFRHFERYGNYIMPDALPYYSHDPYISDPKVFPETLQSLHDAGHYSMTMVNGRDWTISRAGQPGDAYWVPAYDGMVQGCDGSMVPAWDGDVCFLDTQTPRPKGAEVTTIALSSSGTTSCSVDGDCVTQGNREDVCEGGQCVHRFQQTQAWGGLRAYMCVNHPFYEQLHTAFAERMAGDGLDLYEFDQFNGGGAAACYSTEHGHPMGRGRWMATDTATALANVRSAGQLKNPDFALSMEDPGELWLPYIDVFMCRANKIYPFPAVNSGDPTTNDFSEIVPAFQFVYGGAHARCLGADNPMNGATPASVGFNAQHKAVRLARMGTSGSWLVAQMETWQLLNGYTLNQAPLLPAPDQMYQPHLELLTHVTQTSAGVAHAFFNHGMMLSAAVNSPEITFIEKKSGQDLTRVQPSVSFSAWGLQDDTKGMRRALYVVNSFLGGADIDDPSTPDIDEATGAVTVAIPSVLGGTTFEVSELVRVTTNGTSDETLELGEIQPLKLSSLDAVWIEYGVSDADDESVPDSEGAPEAVVESMPEPGPEMAGDSGPEPVSEPGPEVAVDPGPEPRPDAGPSLDAGSDGAVATDTSGPSSPDVSGQSDVDAGTPQVDADTQPPKADSSSCGGAPSGSMPWALLLAFGLLVRGRRRAVALPQ